MNRSLFLVLASLAASVACTHAAESTDDDNAIVDEALVSQLNALGAPAALGLTSTAKEAMPREVQAYLDMQQWGQHHLEWHTTRQWDRLGLQGQKWARQQGWARATVQEGEKNNGLEFLAMHHVMFNTLRKQFPNQADKFKGWEPIPRDPRDPAWPVLDRSLQTPMAATAIKALDLLANLAPEAKPGVGLAGFATDDELGLFLETTARPRGVVVPANAGTHNYLHGRFSRQGSDVDMGDPALNLKNQYFWKLHGFIENTWLSYRKVKGRTEVDSAQAEPLLKQYLAAGDAHMNRPASRGLETAPHHADALGVGAAPGQSPLDQLRKLARRDFIADVAQADAASAEDDE